jgi:hypothetical protein
LTISTTIRAARGWCATRNIGDFRRRCGITGTGAGGRRAPDVDCLVRRKEETFGRGGGMAGRPCHKGGFTGKQDIA